MLWLGFFELENEFLKEAKNPEKLNFSTKKCYFWGFLASFKISFSIFHTLVMILGIVGVLLRLNKKVFAVNTVFHELSSFWNSNWYDGKKDLILRINQDISTQTTIYCVSSNFLIRSSKECFVCIRRHELMWYTNEPL